MSMTRRRDINGNIGGYVSRGFLLLTYKDVSQTCIPVRYLLTYLLVST